MTVTITTDTATTITMSVTITKNPTTTQSQESPLAHQDEERTPEQPVNERTHFRRLALDRISTLIAQGRTIIKLHDDLYAPLGAEGKGETMRKNGIRYGVRDAKTKNVIRKTGVHAVYAVV